MSTRRPPPRGASRSPRQGSGNASRSTASGGRKPAVRAKTPARKPAGGIRKGRLILAVLLAIGLAALIWFVKKHHGKAVETVPPALAQDKPGKSGADAGPDKKPDNTAKAHDDPERFEFYDILPNQQVLPTRQIENRPPPRPLPANAAPRPIAAADEAPRWLQAGAFRSPEEADRRRAQIRLLGLPARVQAGSDGQGQHLHRVLAGPFNSATGLDGARRTLAAAGLDAIPLSNPAQSSTGVPQP